MARPAFAARYVLFLLLAFAFILQIAFSAWSLQSSIGHAIHAHADQYLLTIGVLGFLFVLSLTLIDSLRRNAFLTRVWVEAVGIGLFFLMEIGGAVALTVLITQVSCNRPGPRHLTCSPVHANLGIVWTVTVLTLVYISTLIISAVVHHEEYPHVWQSGVQDFPWFEHSKCAQRISSTPPSPTKKYEADVKFGDRTVPQLVIPVPRRAYVQPLQTFYEVEHVRTSDLDVRMGSIESHQPPSTSEHPQEVYRPHGAAPATNPISLYPAYVESALPPMSSNPNLPSQAPEPFQPAGQWPPPANSASNGRQKGRRRETPADSAQGRAVRAPRTRPPPLDLTN